MNNSTSNVYVQSLTLNGRPVNTTHLSQSQLAGGGVLRFTMGPRPSSWGSGASDAPASLSTAGSGTTMLQDAAAPGAGPATGSGGTDVSALFDDTSATQVTFNSATPWVRYDLPEPTKVAYYTLTSGSAAGGPAAWSLEGSDDGTHWTTLDTRSGQTFTDRQQTEDFAVASPGDYRDYRLVITANSGTVTTTLSEIQFLTLGTSRPFRLPTPKLPSPRAAWWSSPASPCRSRSARRTSPTRPTGHLVRDRACRGHRVAPAPFTGRRTPRASTTATVTAPATGGKLPRRVHT